MRKIVFIFVLLFSMSGVAHESSELNKTMKEMGHIYKQAMKAQSAQEMQAHLTELTTLVNESKQFQFKQEVSAESVEGLNKVLETITKASHEIDSGRVEKAREMLLKIDELRKQYHKLHEPPGFWELLFGS
ncbi:cytochrome b562 [Pseudoalteromonas sp. L23]|uniref:cytochrome b562 n=1 Tax=unclassified Pseudoalteromonas TaxID=194690 RepID=UPI001F4261AC|nr:MULTISPECIES: cytochrome b562 [unclassified Pseudoalteromonas]MCF2826275.1 cytochrome b562 [Pseudoalteromonas sp. OF5H-5]MCF2830213.1 cytochrome b562 [Pseudoalteromonas sp. DL2-H6]MCF2926308.1 cytochrome b562 [Pseudoalteromonas sp. DL2-H1]MCF7513551.1 cytochrome b562 [Pseudoalteromonas sp. L7]MCF7525472.1 cytochrome b562 [Pseudoalteromonas sp. L23]